jgi:hypothetical protein
MSALKLASRSGVTAGDRDTLTPSCSQAMQVSCQAAEVQWKRRVLQTTPRASFFPMMVSLGVSKPAAAAMIALCSFMDLGPAVGTANLAARTAGIPPAVYFVRYQIPVVVWVIGVVAILIFSSARYFDRRSDSSIFQAQPEPSMGEQIRNDAPGFYAFLPLFPITLILVFSPLLVSDVTVDVVTAMVLGSVAGLVCELLVKRDVRAVFKGFQVFFNSIGSSFASVVSLLVCADVFAQGLEVVGAVGYLIESVRDAGFGINVMAFIMTLLVGVTAMIERKWTSGFSLAGTFEGGFFQCHPQLRREGRGAVCVVRRHARLIRVRRTARMTWPLQRSEWRAIHCQRRRPRRRWRQHRIMN